MAAPKPPGADGMDIGAREGRSASEFHAGGFEDIRDYGAAVNGSTDDTQAVYDAAQAAVSNGTAVYIPKGVVLTQNGLQFGSSFNGVKMVGEGYDSVIRIAGGKSNNYDTVLLRDTSAAVRDIEIANLRMDGNHRNHSGPGNGWAFRAWESGHSDGGIRLENVWAHNATGTSLYVGMQNVTVNRATAWNTGKWHGIATDVEQASGSVEIWNALAFNNTGYGIDLSSGDTTVDRFYTSGNGYGGFKTTSETRTAKFRNGIAENNSGPGYQTTGSANVVLDQTLCRDNGAWGYRFSENSSVTVGEIYAIGNSDHNVYFADTSVTATEVQACDGGRTGVYIGSGASGSIETVVASGNSGSDLGGNTGLVGSFLNQSCSVPDVIGPGTVPPVDVIVEGANEITISPR